MDVLELTPGVDLLQSMRSVGYSFETAVADVVDNSITAGATEIEIQVDVAQGQWVTIRDNGHGMSSEEVREALRLAGTARTTPDTTESLGRFGLGLKTASLSQGRRVDVITRKDDSWAGLAWDIDTVATRGKWVVEVLDEVSVDEAGPDLRIPRGSTGTVVMWSKLDFLIGKAVNLTDHLSEKVESLRLHLGLVFHRFLEGRTAISIVLNGCAVKPVDPFLSSHPKTQRTPQQVIDIEGFPVVLQGFTLPHSRSLSEELRTRFDLGAALRENQGFYIYRNQRLISHGGWFGLRPREELTKQARVRVDITDGLDYLWQVDIRKARSEPPAEFRGKVKPLLDRLVMRSERLHTHRERRVRDSVYDHYWSKVQTRDGVRFAVNVDHPVVRRLLGALPPKDAVLFREFLTGLADFFPYYDSYVATAKSQIAETESVSDEAAREKLMALRESGFSREEVDEFVRDAEPYRDVANLGQLMKEIWSDVTE